jgi:hypothetical protein
LITATAVFNAAEDMIATLEVEGTAAGDLLITATAVFDDSQAMIATLEVEATTAAQQLATATAVFDDSQAIIATLEVEATTASRQLATATAVFDDSQATIATLEVEATTASRQLATATARIGLVEEDLATIEAQATAQAREQATLERDATAQAREQATLAREATAVAQDFATLQGQATAAAESQGNGGNNNEAAPPPLDLDSALALADGVVDAGITDRADEVVIAFPRLTLDLSDENNVSLRQWYPNAYNDFVMGVTITFNDEGADEDECGLSFRDQDDSNFYTVRLNRDGDVRFLVRVNGDWQSNQAADRRVRLRGEPSEWLLIGEGSHFTLLINGEEVGSWRDNRLENGRLGLVAATFAESDDTGCEFTNAWVLDLDGR